MHPVELQEKWTGVIFAGRSASQSHFLDLCRVLGVPAPTDFDREGSVYTVEKGAGKSTGGKGWDDDEPATVEEDVILGRLLALNGKRAAGR